TELIDRIGSVANLNSRYSWRTSAGGIHRIDEFQRAPAFSRRRLNVERKRLHQVLRLRESCKHESRGTRRGTSKLHYASQLTGPDCTAGAESRGVVAQSCAAKVWVRIVNDDRAVRRGADRDQKMSACEHAITRERERNQHRKALRQKIRDGDAGGALHSGVHAPCEIRRAPEIRDLLTGIRIRQVSIAQFSAIRVHATEGLQIL